MRSMSGAPNETGGDVPELRSDADRQRTEGDGVVRVAKERRRDPNLGDASHGLRRTVVPIILGTALGVTMAISANWFSPELVAALTSNAP